MFYLENFNVARSTHSFNGVHTHDCFCCRGGNASLACLVDTPHQTRVVELLIINAENLFGPIEDHMLVHGETIVEQMEQRNTLQVPQPATLGRSK